MTWRGFDMQWLRQFTEREPESLLEGQELPPKRGRKSRVPAFHHAETMLATQIRLAGMPEPVCEFRFCPTRKWRSDFAYPERKVLIEIEGGVWTEGRHVRGRGYLADIEKYNTAALMGYRLLRVTPDDVRKGRALKLISQELAQIA